MINKHWINYFDDDYSNIQSYSDPMVMLTSSETTVVLWYQIFVSRTTETNATVSFLTNPIQSLDLAMLQTNVNLIRFKRDVCLDYVLACNDASEWMLIYSKRLFSSFTFYPTADQGCFSCSIFASFWQQQPWADGTPTKKYIKSNSNLIQNNNQSNL